MPIDRIKGSGDNLAEVNASDQLEVSIENTPEVKITDGTDIAAVDASGNIGVSLRKDTYPVSIAHTTSDAVPLTLMTLHVVSKKYGFDGTYWNRWRNNTEGTILVQAARTASIYSTDQTNYNHKGIYVCMNVTAITGAPSVQMRLLAKDPISGLLTQITQYTTAITAVGRYMLALHPGLIDTAGTFHLACDAMLPRTWQLYVKHANANSINYSVSYQLMV